MNRLYIEAALDIDDRDAGCEVTCKALERYVEAELRGHQHGRWVDGIAVHLSRCTACRTDHDGLLAIIGPQIGASRATCPIACEAVIRAVPIPSTC